MINHRKLHIPVILAVCLLLSLLGIRVQAQGEGITEIFSFDNPALPGWELSPNATVADGLMRIQGAGYAFYPSAAASGGLTLHLQFEGDGFLELRYQISETGMYLLRLTSEEILLVRESGGHQIILDSASSGLITGEWSLLELSLAGAEQQVFIGPEIEIHATDENPLPDGGLMMHVFGEAAGEFDDLILLPGGEGSHPGVTPQQPESILTTEPRTSRDLTWIRTGGPPGGLGYDIRYNFSDPNIWYVTDAYSGIHISIDDGFTWKPANEGIPPQSGSTGDAIPVFSLTVDPLDPQILWAGTQGTGHIYRSSDGGRTWEQRDTGIIVEHDSLTFRGFTVDPQFSDSVYAMGEINSEALGGPSLWGNGTGGIIYKTTDAGLNWVKIWDGGIPSSLTRYLWIDPTNPETLYASTGIFDRGAIGEGDPETDPFGGIGILVSTDGGSTWTIQGKDHGLRMLYLGSLYMHPENPRILLAAAGHAITGIASYADLLRSTGESSPTGIYRTEDGGQHWIQVLIPPDDRMLEAFSAVEFCPGNPTVAYAASQGRVYRSADTGLTWEELPSSVLGWGPGNIVTGFPIDIQCDPRDADRLFINNYGGGNFLSEDGGRTWVNVSNGYTGAIISRVAVDQKNSSIVYSAGPSGIWQSIDGGGHWDGIANSTADVRLDLDWNTIVIDPSDPQHILLAGSPEIYKSLDSGQTWRKAVLTNNQGKRLEDDGLAGLPPISIIAFAASDPRIGYAGFADGPCINYHEHCRATGGAFLTSQDGGASWILYKGALPVDAAIFDLGIDPNRPEVLFAASEAGLYRSMTGGSSWQLVNQESGGARVSAVAVDPAEGNHILMSIDRLGLWESMDSGDTWQARSAGLEPNAIIHDIIFDPTHTDIVYLNDISSGTYRSWDGGQTWERINQGLSMRAVTGMDISSDGQHLYVGTQGGGVFRLDLNGQAPISNPALNPSDLVPTPASDRVSPRSEARAAGISLAIILVAAAVVMVVVVLIFLGRHKKRPSK